MEFLFLHTIHSFSCELISGCLHSLMAKKQAFILPIEALRIELKSLYVCSKKNTILKSAASFYIKFS